MNKKLMALVVLMSSAAWAKEPVFFPEKGQSTEKMEEDKTYCSGWAMEQAKNSDTAAVEVKTEGSAVRGGARGAAAGAAIGAAAGDAGKGAAIGAAAAGVAARRRAKRAEAYQEAAVGDYYYRSLAACMKGKGYSAN